MVGLLLGSIVLSGGFWFWGNFQEKNSLELVFLPTPTPTLKTEEAVQKITDLVKSLKGSYGVYVFNLTTKHSYGIKGNDIFTAASLIKLPVLLTLYQQAEKGQVSLEGRYALRQEDRRPGAGSLQYQPAGKTFSYRQLAELMGQQSDNTAFTALLRILGEKKIQATIEELGMSQTSFSKNETTPKDIGLFFRKLYGGSVVTREHRDEILAFLTKTAFEDRIPAGVPEGVKVSHKIGNEIGVFSDGGIVFGERPFILVIMSKNALEREAKTALPAITKVVWEFENK